MNGISLNRFVESTSICFYLYKTMYFYKQCFYTDLLILLLGKCLELEYPGYLDNVNCEQFTAGCPDTYYLSNEIYNCEYLNRFILNYLKSLINDLSQNL